MDGLLYILDQLGRNLAAQQAENVALKAQLDAALASLAAVAAASDDSPPA
jgi:hypothetical protein